MGVGKQGAVVSGSWAWRAVGVGIGMASAAQTTINGHLGTVAGSSLHAAEINLAVGALLLFAIALVTSPRQLVTRPEPGPWWMWVGGLVGATFVISGATLAPLLGTATTVIVVRMNYVVPFAWMEANGHTGGLLDQAVSVSDTFIDHGEIVSTRGRNPEDNERWNAEPGDLAQGKPMVALINGGSASAADASRIDAVVEQLHQLPHVDTVQVDSAYSAGRWRRSWS